MVISHFTHRFARHLPNPPIAESDPTKSIPLSPTINSTLRDTPAYLRTIA